MFISPSEPREIQELGIVSSMPEDYGVDIMWNSELGTVGVQRKVFPSDFMSSRSDGRLVLQFAQMKSLDVAILLLEGKQNWTLDGELYGAYGAEGRSYTWTRDQHRNFLASVQLRGVQVQSSDSIQDTVRYLRSLRLWTDKGDHLSLDRRPAAKGDLWGTVRNEDYVKFLYQSLPRVGPKSAAMIWKHLGMIFQLKVTAEELATVPGIGKGIANKIVGVFNDLAGD
jgi:ERCC4-type nuclease